MSFQLQALSQSLSSLSSSPLLAQSPIIPKTPSRDASPHAESSSDGESNERQTAMELKETPEQKQEIIDFLVMANEIKKQRRHLLNLEKEYANVREKLSTVMVKDGVTNIDLNNMPPEFIQQVGGLGTIELRHRETPYKCPAELSIAQFRQAVSEGLQKISENINVDAKINEWVEQFKARHFPKGKMCRITTTHRKFQHLTSFKRKPTKPLTPIDENEGESHSRTKWKKQKRSGGHTTQLFEQRPDWFQ